MNENIFGNWATLLLPLNEDESINYHQYVEQIKHLISCNVDGIYSNGTAGEFIAISNEEFQTTTAIFANLCIDAGVPFQIGCSHPSAQISLERIAFAKQFKPTAIQVILPEWFPVTNKEAINFFKKVEEVSDKTPLTLYNPPHAKRKLSPADFLEIFDAIPSIVSIKVCDGDQSWYDSMAEVLKRVSVFVPGHHLATGVKNGAAGAYSNVACISPSRAQAWFDLMKTDLDAALEEEKNIQAFMKECIADFIIIDKHANFVIDKFMAVMGGYTDIKNISRLPYENVPDKHILPVRKKLLEIAPFFADEKIR